MDTIYTEFKASMENIYNTFYISFLALKPFIDKPFKSDFVIPVEDFYYSIIKKEQLNKLGNDSLNEYVNSIGRHMLNDLVICYERYATQMIASHNNKKTRLDPALTADRSINSSSFEKLDNVYTLDEITYFTQLRRLRNSIVHYNGVYCKTNKLDFSFDEDVYYSDGNEGVNIRVKLDTLIWIYNKILVNVQNVNSRYFVLYG